MPSSILRARSDRSQGRSRLGAHSDAFPQRKPLDRDEEVVLVGLAARGDRDALTRLFEAHFPLLVRIALAYERPGLEPEDLIGEACVGFTEALARFQPERNTRFMTSASWWVRQHVVLALERAKNVRLPRRARAKVGNLREISLSEPASEASTYREEAFEAEPLADESLDGCERRHDVDRALATLPTRQQQLLRRRFGLDSRDDDGVTLRRLAVEMGVSRERVRQLEHDALGKMRDAMATPAAPGPRSPADPRHGLRAVAR